MRALPALAKLCFAAFLVSAFIGLTAALGARFGYFTHQFGLFTLFPWCVGVGGFAAAAGVIWILWAMIANDSTGARYGLIGLVGAIALLVDPVYDFYQAWGMPPITDVSTDTVHPPAFVTLQMQPGAPAGLSDYDGATVITFDGKPSSLALLQHYYYGPIHSFPVLISPERLFKRAVTAAYAMGWDIVAIDPDAGRIEATDSTFFFGFTDDIVVRVKPAGMGARLDVRSKALEPDTDGGRNARRVMAYIKRLAAMN